MAMRSQVYEYTETTGGTIRDNQTSIFTGGLGTSITKPAETTATQFVVIEQVAATPSLPSTYDGAGIATYTQVRINTTEYFLKPDNIPNDGVPEHSSTLPKKRCFPTFFQPLP